jgi:hypothetical protein
MYHIQSEMYGIEVFVRIFLRSLYYTLLERKKVEIENAWPGFEQRLDNKVYENYKDNELIVEIYASRRRIKEKRLERKIEDIVNEASC